MIATTDIDLAAKGAAGNWRKFESFAWWRQHDMEDADKWGVFYTHNRDSGLLDQSNSAVIEKALESFTDGDDPDVVMESHNHWAVGHVDGFSVRIFDGRGSITAAFQAYFELTQRLADYPVLDESDYSNREYEATLENIESAAWRLKRQFTLPEDWTSQVYSWLSDNDSAQVENRDEQGGYPNEESLRAAFVALNFEEQEA